MAYVRQFIPRRRKGRRGESRSLQTRRGDNAPRPRCRKMMAFVVVAVWGRDDAHEQLGGFVRAGH